MIPFILTVLGGYLIGESLETESFADGGSIAESNNRMLRSKVKEVKHHADELGKVVKPNTEVEGWVVAKAERSASDLSDITHYLDGQEFADGGQIDEASISNIHRNVMGTISFNMKLKGMRKAQDFIVYPITAEDAGNPIKVQSDTRIGYIDLPTGRGLMSQSHSGGAYNHHLQMDQKIRFTLSNSDAELLKDSIKGTAGSSVGTRGVTTDNAGASKLADGGKTSQKFLLSVMKNEKVGGKDMLVSGQPVSVTGTMKDAEAKAKEIIKDSSVGEVSISKYNEKGRLGKKLKTINQ